MPPSGEITMTLSRNQCNPDKKVTMERYQEVMVALSESVIEMCMQRPLVEK